MAYEISMPKFIQGKGAAVDAIRTMATNKIGLEPSEDPKKDFQKEASGSTSRTSR